MSCVRDLSGTFFFSNVNNCFSFRGLITQFDKKKVIFCPHVLMMIFPFLGGKNDGK